MEEKSRAVLIKLFKEGISRAEQQLGRTKVKSEKKRLRDFIGEIKFGFACELLRCREYEKALGLFNSRSWRTDGEMKFNEIAGALIDAKDYNEAREVLEMGLKKFPKSYALWVAMGTLYDSMGDCFEALKCFDTALLFAPKDNSVALFNKALILMDLSCHKDALAIMQDLAQSYPDDPKYAAEKGRFFLGMGYLEEAMVTYLEAIDVWQRSQSIETGVCIYTGLCSTYVELGMKTEALKIAHEGLEKFPDQDPYLYQNMGAVFYEMGWRSEAIEILEKGIKKFPGDEDLKEFLKDLEDETDDPSDGETPPLLGLILLMLLLYKKSIRRK